MIKNIMAKLKRLFFTIISLLFLSTFLYVNNVYARDDNTFYKRVETNSNILSIWYQNWSDITPAKFDFYVWIDDSLGFTNTWSIYTPLDRWFDDPWAIEGINDWYSDGWVHDWNVVLGTDDRTGPGWAPLYSWDPIPAWEFVEILRIPNTGWNSWDVFEVELNYWWYDFSFGMIYEESKTKFYGHPNDTSVNRIWISYVAPWIDPFENVGPTISETTPLIASISNWGYYSYTFTWSDIDSGFIYSWSSIPSWLSINKFTWEIYWTASVAWNYTMSIFTNDWYSSHYQSSSAIFNFS